MTRSPTPPAERYLDVARTLGVSDAALRRHHEVDADASLRATLADGLSSPTDELVALLAAAGVVLDLDAVDPDDATGIALCLSRFGFVVECAEVSGEVEIVATDVVADDVEHVRAEPAAEPLRTALRERVLEPAGVQVVELVDGRTLVADARSLALLRDRYGPRVEPFETPLLAADVDPDDLPPAASTAASTATAAASGPAADAGAVRDSAVGDAADAPVGDAADGPVAGSGDAPLGDADDASFGEFLASADADEAAEVEGALAAGGPRVHTTEDETDELDRAAADVGGGPRRTVSSTGIDEVFADLEAAADAGGSGGGDAAAVDAGAAATDDDPFTQPIEEEAAASESHDASGHAADPATGSADGDDGPFVGGGPTRTVSETSADDILQRVSGDADFEDIADEEGEADPDAVLDDAEELPELPEDATDGGTVVDDAAASSGDGADDASEPTDGTDEPVAEATDAGDAETDDPVAGDAAAASEETTDEDPSADGAGEFDPADPVASNGVGHSDAADSSDVADSSGAANDSDPADGSDATDGSDVADGSDDDQEFDDGGVDASPSGDAASVARTPGTEDLEDALVGDDVEVRGSEHPDLDIERGSRAGRPSTDGPLARAGGVSPSASSGAASGADSPSAATETAADRSEASDAESSGDDAGSASLLERVRSVFRR